MSSPVTEPSDILSAESQPAAAKPERPAPARVSSKLIENVGVQLEAFLGAAR